VHQKGPVLRVADTTAFFLGIAMLPGSAIASSHMDAPPITFDDPANTTDV
jgi:hypothetical protein